MFAYLENAHFVFDRFVLVTADVAAGSFGQGQPAFQARQVDHALGTDAITRRHQILMLVLCERQSKDGSTLGEFLIVVQRLKIKPSPLPGVAA